MLKGLDVDLRFVFLTSVSKFSEVSLFSGLNNLEDIALAPGQDALCGYTDADVNCVFTAEFDAATSSWGERGTHHSFIKDGGSTLRVS